MKHSIQIPNEVISIFAERNNITIKQSRELHKKLDDFLLRCSMTNESLSPTDDVDDAWHSFILFTKVYGKYCIEKYGKFIHHVPFSESERLLNNAKCNDGTGDGNCSNQCGQGNCNSDGDGRHATRLEELGVLA